MVKETRELYEERLVELLTKMETMDPNDDAYGGYLDAVNTLSDKLAMAEKNAMDLEDKTEKRRIEEDRNEAQTEVEKEKQRIGWKKVTFEMMKIVTPIVTGGIIFDRIHNKVMKYEEEGRITSTSGRNIINLASRFFKI